MVRSNFKHGHGRTTKRNRTEGDSPSPSSVPFSSEVYSVREPSPSTIPLSRIELMEQNLTALITNQLSNVDKRLNSIDAKIEKQDSTFDAVNSRFDKIEAELEQLRSRPGGSTANSHDSPISHTPSVPPGNVSFSSSANGRSNQNFFPTNSVKGGPNKSRVWILGFPSKELKATLSDATEKFLARFPENLKVGIRYNPMNITKAVPIDFPSFESALAFVQYNPREPLEYELPTGATARLFCRMDRSIEQRDVTFILQQMWNQVYQHLNTIKLLESRPNLRIGKNMSELYAFDDVSRVCHVLFTCRKDRLSPVQAKVGDQLALDMIQISQDQMQSLVSTALDAAKKREADRF